ncbi:LytTR family DNA-binding domain-containing protein [Luteimonas sp. 100069]|uniref:LytR/AlgR family response regulator transcription factor n=1 Tax=Luteimonas sp. 100069 TaxID=2006109 RepID=UPI000F50E713|nr:LytTR family DNA-binding domain-containing protein [Luteimonas sp. 100069]RPD88001.1 DNA-binding response regulator [Luteimonas sp. 100069]
MSTRALRAAIVDDELLARQRLLRMLGELGGVDVVGCYGDGHQALEGLAARPADVLFLDIRMPQLDGFQLIELLPAKRPLVVFVSAYGERALDAFAVEAVDYLVKPLSPLRLRDALARVRAWRGRLDPPAPVAQAGARYPERLAVPDGERVRMVPVEQISMLVAQGNYVELVLPARRLLLREPLSALVARLDPARFVRVHRSRAVRVDLIEQVEPYGAGQYWLRLRDGTCLASGRSYRHALREVLGLRA